MYPYNHNRTDWVTPDFISSRRPFAFGHMEANESIRIALDIPAEVLEEYTVLSYCLHLKKRAEDDMLYSHCPIFMPPYADAVKFIFPDNPQSYGEDFATISPGTLNAAINLVVKALHHLITVVKGQNTATREANDGALSLIIKGIGRLRDLVEIASTEKGVS